MSIRDDALATLDEIDALLAGPPVVAPPVSPEEDEEDLERERRKRRSLANVQHAQGLGVEMTGSQVSPKPRMADYAGPSADQPDADPAKVQASVDESVRAIGRGSRAVGEFLSGLDLSPFPPTLGDLYEERVAELAPEMQAKAHELMELSRAYEELPEKLVPKGVRSAAGKVREAASKAMKEAIAAEPEPKKPGRLGLAVDTFLTAVGGMTGGVVGAGAEALRGEGAEALKSLADVIAIPAEQSGRLAAGMVDPELAQEMGTVGRAVGPVSGRLGKALKGEALPALKMAGGGEATTPGAKLAAEIYPGDEDAQAGTEALHLGAEIALPVGSFIGYANRAKSAFRYGRSRVRAARAAAASAPPPAPSGARFRRLQVPVDGAPPMPKDVPTGIDIPPSSSGSVVAEREAAALAVREKPTADLVRAVVDMEPPTAVVGPAVSELAGPQEAAFLAKRGALETPAISPEATELVRRVEAKYGEASTQAIAAEIAAKAPEAASKFRSQKILVDDFPEDVGAVIDKHVETLSMERYAELVSQQVQVQAGLSFDGADLRAALLGPAVVQRVYHGTPVAYEAVDLSKAKPGRMGSGLYVTDEASVAGGYAGRAPTPQEMAVYKQRIAEYSARGESTEFFERLITTPNVRFGRIRSGAKFLDLDEALPDDVVGEVIRKFGDRNVFSAQLNEMLGREILEYVPEGQFKAVLRAAGYEGFTEMGGKAGGKPNRHWAVWDPKKTLIEGTEAEATVARNRKAIQQAKPGTDLYEEAITRYELEQRAVAEAEIARQAALSHKTQGRDIVNRNPVDDLYEADLLPDDVRDAQALEAVKAMVAPPGAPPPQGPPPGAGPRTPAGGGLVPRGPAGGPPGVPSAIGAAPKPAALVPPGAVEWFVPRLAAIAGPNMVIGPEFDLMLTRPGMDMYTAAVQKRNVERALPRAGEMGGFPGSRKIGIPEDWPTLKAWDGQIPKKWRADAFSRFVEQANPDIPVGERLVDRYSPAEIAAMEADPGMVQARDQYTKLMDALAEAEGIPPGKRKSGYWPHFWDKKERRAEWEKELKKVEKKTDPASVQHADHLRRSIAYLDSMRGKTHVLSGEFGVPHYLFYGAHEQRLGRFPHLVERDPIKAIRLRLKEAGHFIGFRMFGQAMEEGSRALKVGEVVPVADQDRRLFTLAGRPLPNFGKWGKKVSHIGVTQQYRTLVDDWLKREFRQTDIRTIREQHVADAMGRPGPFSDQTNLAEMTVDLANSVVAFVDMQANPAFAWNAFQHVYTIPGYMGFRYLEPAWKDMMRHIGNKARGGKGEPFLAEVQGRLGVGLVDHRLLSDVPQYRRWVSKMFGSGVGSLTELGNYLGVAAARGRQMTDLYAAIQAAAPRSTRALPVEIAEARAITKAMARSAARTTTTEAPTTVAGAKRLVGMNARRAQDRRWMETARAVAEGRPTPAQLQEYIKINSTLRRVPGFMDRVADEYLLHQSEEIAQHLEAGGFLEKHSGLFVKDHYRPRKDQLRTAIRWHLSDPNEGAVQEAMTAIDTLTFLNHQTRRPLGHSMRGGFVGRLVTVFMPFFARQSNLIYRRLPPGGKASLALLPFAVGGPKALPFLGMLAYMPVVGEGVREYLASVDNGERSTFEEWMMKTNILSALEMETPSMANPTGGRVPYIQVDRYYRTKGENLRALEAVMGYGGAFLSQASTGLLAPLETLSAMEGEALRAQAFLASLLDNLPHAIPAYNAVRYVQEHPDLSPAEMAAAQFGLRPQRHAREYTAAEWAKAERVREEIKRDAAIRMVLEDPSGEMFARVTSALGLTRKQLSEGIAARGVDAPLRALGETRISSGNLDKAMRHVTRWAASAHKVYDAESTGVGKVSDLDRQQAEWFWLGAGRIAEKLRDGATRESSPEYKAKMMHWYKYVLDEARAVGYPTHPAMSDVNMQETSKVQQWFNAKVREMPPGLSRDRQRKHLMKELGRQPLSPGWSDSQRISAHGMITSWTESRVDLYRWQARQREEMERARQRAQELAPAGAAP